MKRDTKLLSSQLKAHGPLVEIFDVPLTGCALTFSLLDIELQKLYDRSKDNDTYRWKHKMRYVWNEDQAKAILDHMRGLQSAVNLMLTALQTYVSYPPTLSRQEHRLISRRSSTSAFIGLLQDQKPVIERVRKDTNSIRESLSLQLDLTADVDRQVPSENYSILSSTIGDEEFSFDDEIINSFAYRSAIKKLASKAKGTRQNAKPDERHLLDEPLIDLEELSQTHSGLQIESTAIPNYHCLTPNITSTHTALHSDTTMEDLKSLMPIHIDSASGISNSVPVNLGDDNRDTGEVIRQRARDGEYQETQRSHKLPRKPVQAAVEPLRTSSQSTSVGADTTKQFEPHVIFPAITFDESSCSVTRSSILSEEIETPSSPWKERQRAGLVVDEIPRWEPHLVSPSAPNALASVTGSLETCHIAGSVPLISPKRTQIPIRTQRRDYTSKTETDRSRKRRSSRTTYFPEISRNSRTTPSSAKDNYGTGIKQRRQRHSSEAFRLEEELQRHQINEDHDQRSDDHPYSNDFLENDLITSNDKALDDPDAKKRLRRRTERASIGHQYSNIGNVLASEDGGISGIRENTSRKTRRISPRRRSNKQINSDPEGFAVAAAALARHEGERSTFNPDTDASISRQKNQPDRRMQNNDQDPGHEFSLPRNIKPGIGNEVPKNPSFLANPTLLNTIENAIRELILPELEELNEPLKQERIAKNQDQSHEPSHRNLKASPITRANGNRTDIHERTDRTIQSTPADGCPANIHKKKRRQSRDKDWQRRLIRVSFPERVEYFEGGKGPNA